MTWAAGAYSATGAAWQRGPGRIYDRLAEIIVGRSPLPLAGLRALDVGSGTGAASRALVAAGASVVETDIAPGMLAVDRANRPPAAVADARSLPFASGTFHAVVAAFCLNHVPDPAAGLREAARVAVPDGVLLASSYANGDSHPAKTAAERALADAGWRPHDGHDDLQKIVALLAAPAGMRSAAEEAGLRDVAVDELTVDFPGLDAHALIEWRFGTAMHAPFVARLEPREQNRARARALELLGEDPPLLRRHVLILAARAPSD